MSTDNVSRFNLHQPYIGENQSRRLITLDLYENATHKNLNSESNACDESNLKKQIFIYVMTSGTTSQEIWMFATGELWNQSNQIFCDLTRHMIYISEYKQTLVRFRLRSYENEKRYFSVVLFRPNFSCKFLNINFSIIFGQISAQCKLKSSERSNWLER